MPKKVVDEDEEEEEVIDEEEEELKDGSFVCRVCNKETTMGEGDDMILLCDNCQDKYDINIDKIWEDFDAEKILEENLKKFDITPYMKKKPGAAKKSTAAAGAKKSSAQKK